MEDIKNTFSEYHIPVLFYETMEYLITNKDGVYLDCTLGGGGHTEGILKNTSDKARVISTDQDQQAIDFASKRLEPFKDRWKVYKDNFENLDTVLYCAGYDKIDGILMDIGVSSTQLDDEERGFSYRFDTKLDMRMDKSNPVSAYEVVNNYSEEDLSRIIFEYGEERFARKIAKFICEARKEKNIETTGELVSIIRRAYPARSQKHPAKKTFQAIRIEVNRELEVLERAIEKAVKSLKKGGRLAIITFHSLEDRIVKNFFREKSGKTAGVSRYVPDLNPPKNTELSFCSKAILPTEQEIETNSRSHSAKLRYAIKNNKETE